MNVIYNRSVENINFPSKSVSSWIKKETSDFEMPESEFYPHETNYFENEFENPDYDMKLSVPEKSKKSKKTKGKKKKNVEISTITEEQNEPYKCEICGKSYKVYNLLYNHKRSVHEGKKLGNSSTNEQQNNTFKCDICGKSYMIYGNLKNHIAVVHEGKGKMRNPKGTNPKKTKERKYKHGQVIWAVVFSKEEYIIKYIFGQKTISSRKIIVFCELTQCSGNSG